MTAEERIRVRAGGPVCRRRMRLQNIAGGRQQKGANDDKEMNETRKPAQGRLSWRGSDSALKNPGLLDDIQLLHFVIGGGAGFCGGQGGHGKAQYQDQGAHTLLLGPVAQYKRISEKRRDHSGSA